LLPDDFGLATTAMLLGVFVEMCADFGIRQAIVQHRDGGTRRFLDVAWTLALWRSFGVSAVIVLLAGPFAAAMADERLQTLAMLTALLPPLQAACSPGRLAWMRELRQDRINQLDLAVDVARLPLNIAGALLTGNAYGIVFAGIAAEAVRVGLSYVMAPERPRFAYERAVAVDLLRYGRYVFVASVLGFFAVRLDAFFVARFLGMNAAGTYGLAQNMTAPIEGIASQLLGGLLFPYLAKFQHDLPAIRTRMRQVLKALLLGGARPLPGRRGPAAVDDRRHLLQLPWHRAQLPADGDRAAALGHPRDRRPAGGLRRQRLVPGRIRGRRLRRGDRGVDVRVPGDARLRAMDAGALTAHRSGATGDAHGRSPTLRSHEVTVRQPRRRLRFRSRIPSGRASGSVPPFLTEPC
jgi:hypothetical protein